MVTYIQYIWYLNLYHQMTFLSTGLVLYLVSNESLIAVFISLYFWSSFLLALYHSWFIFILTLKEISSNSSYGNSWDKALLFYHFFFDDGCFLNPDKEERHTTDWWGGKTYVFPLYSAFSRSVQAPSGPLKLCLLR